MDENFASEERLLLQQIADGREEAFAALVQKYWNNVYAQALTYLKSSHHAQDLVQDLFVKVWEKRATLPKVERFDAFLFIMARNAIISALRKKLAEPLSTDVIDVYQEHSRMPDQMLSFKQLQQHFKTAIDLLPQQQKTAFLLSREEDLSYEAIAVQMNLSRETVKKHICRALNFLRNYMRIHANIQLSLFFLTLFFC